MQLPTVLVLASGQGNRFIASGGHGSKLNALLAGRTVLTWTLDAAKASGLNWHVEDAGHEGMGDSVAAAVRATPESAGWLILPGDLPLIAPSSLVHVAHALHGHAVVIPTHKGQRGHPVGFASSCRDSLRALRGPLGAQPVVKANKINNAVIELELDDPGIVMDIDTVEDIATAERLLALRAVRSAGHADN